MLKFSGFKFDFRNIIKIKIDEITFIAKVYRTEGGCLFRMPAHDTEKALLESLIDRVNDYLADGYDPDDICIQTLCNGEVISEKWLKVTYKTVITFK